MSETDKNLDQPDDAEEKVDEAPGPSFELAENAQPRSNDWTMRAACKTSDPEALFVQGAAQNRAKGVCLSCSVRTECLADALDYNIEYGVWGGMTERERRALLKRRPNVQSWRRLLSAARAEQVNLSALMTGQDLTQVKPLPPQEPAKKAVVASPSMSQPPARAHLVSVQAMRERLKSMIPRLVKLVEQRTGKNEWWTVKDYRLTREQICFKLGLNDRELTAVIQLAIKAGLLELQYDSANTASAARLRSLRDSEARSNDQSSPDGHQASVRTAVQPQLLVPGNPLQALLAAPHPEPEVKPEPASERPQPPEPIVVPRPEPAEVTFTAEEVEVLRYLEPLLDSEGWIRSINSRQMSADLGFTRTHLGRQLSKLLIRRVVDRLNRTPSGQLESLQITQMPILPTPEPAYHYPQVVTPETDTEQETETQVEPEATSETESQPATPAEAPTTPLPPLRSQDEEVLEVVADNIGPGNWWNGVSSAKLVDELALTPGGLTDAIERLVAHDLIRAEYGSDGKLIAIQRLNPPN